MAYTTNATELVYDFICDKIRNMQWQEGDKIWTEQKFCEELGVSRVAVRQAIDKLVATSTLKKIQGSGTYVQESNPIALIAVPTHIITDEELLDIIRFRVYFDSTNVKQFLKYAREEDYWHLEQVHERLMNCDRASDDFYKYDFEFHRAIADGTGNFYVKQIYTMLMESLLSNQERLHKIIGPEVALEYHPQIIKYILRKDCELASIMMRRHREETVRQVEVDLVMKKEKANGYI